MGITFPGKKTSMEGGIEPFGKDTFVIQGTPADLAQVSGSVKTVGSLATKVDKAGDKNDRAATEAALKALKEALAPLRAIYFKPASK